VNYREAYNMFACNGILFNHESPIRGETFVSRKITRAAARMKMGLQKRLFLGNLDAQRDWGHAVDFIRAMWLILQQDEPDDDVIATGEAHSVREFVELAVDEVGVVKSYDKRAMESEDHIGEGDVVVQVDPRYFRPTEVDLLLGDASKAKKELGWEPRISFYEMVSQMVREDLEGAKRDQLCKESGFRVLDFRDE
jgi:GDPmannose 4,6-dehydratase